MMGRIALGVGIGALGMPPPLVGQFAGLVALAARVAGLVNRGMLDPRPVLAAVLVSVLPFAPACGDDGDAADSASPACEEPRFIPGQWTAFSTCGCNDSSPWRDACIADGGKCVFDEIGSVCLPSCSPLPPCPQDCGATKACPEGCGETQECPVYFGNPSSCDTKTFDCIIPCNGGALDVNCPLGMICAADGDLANSACLWEYGDNL